MSAGDGRPPAAWHPAAGDLLPEMAHGPISRGMLALFAGASNDHTLLQIDSDYAKAAGMPDVFAQGMLVMAYLGHLLTAVARQEDLRSWEVRFAAITPVHAVVRCSGKVREVVADEGERRAVLELVARTGDGQVVLVGEARIAVPPPGPGHRPDR